MKVEFVSFDVFNRIWDDLELTDDDLSPTGVFSKDKPIIKLLK